MADMARGLLAAVTAVMPPGRRGWGKAMIAELDHVPGRRRRAGLVVGAVRVALLPPPGLGEYGQAACRAGVVAVIAWVPLGTALYLANVTFPSTQDNTFGVASMDAYLIVALMVAGMAARRASARLVAPVIAGIAAGLVIAALVMGTLAVIDNVFLTVVSHQQAKINGLRESGMTSMRAYINANLEATAPGALLILASAGGFLALLGAGIAREMATTWAVGRNLLRRGHIPR